MASVGRAILPAAGFQPGFATATRRRGATEPPVFCKGLSVRCAGLDRPGQPGVAHGFHPHRLAHELGNLESGV